MKETIALIEWRNLSAADITTLLALTFTESEIEFAGSMRHAMVLCRTVSRRRLRGYGIRSDEGLVGFVCLKRPPASPIWTPADAVTLHGLKIGTEFRGRGYGGAALDAAFHEARSAWPAARRLLLSVDEDNSNAHRLYLSYGMQPVGVPVRGRVGMEHRLQMLFDTAD